MNTDTLRKAVVPAIVGIVGFSVGGAVGYIVANRRAKRAFGDLVEKSERWSYEQRVGAGVQAMEAYEGIQPHPGIVLEPEERLHDITAPGARIPYYKVIPNNAERFIENADLGIDVTVEELAEALADEAAKIKNAFEDNELYDASDDDWVWEDELSMRSDKTVYVITREEFDDDNMGYRQSTVNWYEGDRMLSDELGEAIYNWPSHIGSELPFGHGSGDENVLFIRNENLKWEYCVTKDPGRFDQDVQGHAVELEYEADDLKHSKQPLKMRRE
jgi:hypothetical protein